MLLTIDVGNSRIKVAVFEYDKKRELFIFDQEKALINIKNIFKKYSNIKRVMLSSVGNLNEEIVHFIQNTFPTIIIDHKTTFPFTNLYTTPKTLGIDRLVLAAGATLLYPKKNRLIIDAGTCITYDFVDNKNNYLGGAISPGIKTRYKSLNDYTAKLPLLEKRRSII